MRQLAKLALVSGLGGCSLIYNPSNLPTEPGDAKTDAPSDAEIILDADPSALELESVFPPVIFEGTGTGGGRPAMLTIHGKQLVAGATVSITPHGGVGAPMITVDNTKADVAANGFIVAVPITVAIDPSLGATQSIRLDVTVTQPVPGGNPVSKTLSSVDVPAPDSSVLTLNGLNELSTATNVSLPSGVHQFSQVNITGNLTAMDVGGPLIVRATGSIAISGTTSVNAAGQGPGAGGSGGGGGGPGIGGTGGTGGGAGGGKPSGGGGGFALPGGGGAAGGAMVGDAALTVLDAPNRGNGGAGGNGGLVNAGGAGGGGGGTIELTAGGTVTVGALEAKGGNGASGNNSDAGGGGSGGVVLVRSGVSVSATIDVSGGTGKNTGSVGRIRIDAPGAVPTTNPVGYRGPTFAATTPVITKQEQASVTVLGEKNTAIKYFYFNEDSSSVRGPFDTTISPTGSNMFSLEQPLFRGLNTLCLQVEGAAFAAEKAEARNCIQIVFLLPPQ